MLITAHRITPVRLRQEGSTALRLPSKRITRRSDLHREGVQMTDIGERVAATLKGELTWY